MSMSDATPSPACEKEQEINRLKSDLKAAEQELTRLKERLADSQRKVLELLHFRGQIDRLVGDVKSEIKVLDKRLQYPESASPLPAPVAQD